MNLIGALDQVAAALTLAGLDNVAVDPRDLDLPGALIAPASVSFDTFDQSTYTLVVDVALVAPDHGHRGGLETLGKLVDQLRAAAGPLGELTAALATLPNHGPDPLPAFTTTITTTIREEPS